MATSFKTVAADFWQGFQRGVRVNRKAYFAPLIAVWRLLLTTTDALTGNNEFPSRGKHQ